MIPGAGTATTVAALAYWRKAGKEIDQLLEKEEYEQLVELHQNSRKVSEGLSEIRKELDKNNWKSSAHSTFSTGKDIAYGFAFTDERLDRTYRGFMNEQHLEEIYHEL